MDLSSLLQFAILAFPAVWRIGDLFANDANAGPFDLLHKLRWLAGVSYDEFSGMYGANGLARGLICIRCNSVWIAALFFAGYLLAPEVAIAVAFVFSLSAVAILYDKITELHA
jgi:hypothetical protein